MTQTLAAGPALVSRWEAGSDPYGRAVITAAVDARRMGVGSPLPAELLRFAAPGYLTRTQQATASANWFEAAMAYATQLLHGAAAALVPVGSDMGRVAGYDVADFLVQNGMRVRWKDVPPAEAWTAYATCATAANDLLASGEQAHRRMLLVEAEVLFHRAVENGSERAILELAQLFHQQGRIDGLEALPKSGPTAEFVARATASLRGQPVEPTGTRGLRLAVSASEGDDRAEGLLRAGAENDPDAALNLGYLLLERRQYEEAQEYLRRALSGSPAALIPLASALVALGRTAEAEELLREELSDGHPQARSMLVDMWEAQGRHAEAEQNLRAAVSANEYGAWETLAARLQDWDRFEDAEVVLRGAVAAGRFGSWHALARCRQTMGRTDEAEAALRQGAEAGDVMSRDSLTQWFLDRGRVRDAEEVLRVAVHHDDPMAVEQLVRLLTGQDRADECEAFLREVVAAGVLDADVALVRLLRERGRQREAAVLQRYGLKPDGTLAGD